MKFRTGQPKFTRLIIGSALSLSVAMALAGCGGGGSGGGGGGTTGVYLVTGKAIDVAYPNGIPNVTVEFVPFTAGSGASGEAITDGSGNFTISGLSANEYGSFYVTTGLGTGTNIYLPSSGEVGTMTFVLEPPPPA